MLKKLAVMVMLLAGCGRAELRVENVAGAPWSDDEVRAHAEAALIWWGSHAEALDGWTVRLLPNTLVCGENANNIWGCCYTDRQIIEIYVPADARWVCETALKHEVGHAALYFSGDKYGDYNHEDRRFLIVNNEEVTCLNAH